MASQVKPIPDGFNSISAIKLAYVLKNPSIYNACLLVIFTVLYDRRAKYEEEIMSRSDSYVHYCQKVKYRFIPRLY